MKTRLGLVFLLIGTLACIRLVEAQNQEGFISLACGWAKDESFTDENTNITYISDEDYIDVGVPMSVNDRYFDYQETWNLRSFPSGLRNCYNLNLKKGNKYLIAAVFLYGNYDKKSETPNFDLYIGPNKWTTVDLSISIAPKRLELVHVLTSNRLQICLVKTGSTTPFMSALELRPLNVDAYNTLNRSLMKSDRYYMQNDTLSSYRYPDDINDRDWDSYFSIGNWGQINTSLYIDTDNEYNLPEAIMRYAAVPINDTVRFVYSWFSADSTAKYQVFMHFAEVQTLRANESREFNITFNGKYLYGPYSPPKLKADTVPGPEPLSLQDFDFEIGFVKTERSTHPPILNAIEFYEVVELRLLETDEIDVDAMMNIKAMYGLNITSWQGDPCVPQDFLWGGLNCSFKDSNPPRITVLKLSSGGLKGQIAPYIANLTELTELDLSHNNLTGKIPEFLAGMKSLSVLNLSGNQLSGSVPEALLKRKSDGSLKLVTDGNPNLCTLESCNKPRTKIVAPVVATVASLAVFMAAFFIIRRKKQNSIKESKHPIQDSVDLTEEDNNRLDQTDQERLSSEIQS